MKKKLSLLIVDDDPDDRAFFIEAAKEIDENIDCMTANDGQKALDLLRNSLSFLPDLIFLDIRMPLLNGKKCLLEIKKDERLKHLPVIIYTTSKVVEESIELKKMGAVHFISKPANADEIYYLLSVMIEEYLGTLRMN
ncbi:MAG TPA: response regulator [Chitinophagaceae bacterium]|jgi:DNA-binding NtrC family response regulator|nr:response regulator [Chitinophagaceae bacterium]